MKDYEYNIDNIDDTNYLSFYEQDSTDAALVVPMSTQFMLDLIVALSTKLANSI